MSAWFLHQGGETSGPFDREALAGLRRDGRILEGTLFWDEAANEWKPIEDCPGWGEIPRERAVTAAAGPPPSVGDPEFAALRVELDRLCTRPGRCHAHPEVLSEFLCQGCGGLGCGECLRYEDGSYLCAACAAKGKKKQVRALQPTENPLLVMLLKHAEIWAAVLIIVPLVGFKVLTGFLDPYKSFPVYYPMMKQAVEIVATSAEMKDAAWAEGIRTRIGEIAVQRSLEAFKARGPADDRTAQYALHLLALDRMRRYEEGLKFIAENPIELKGDPERLKKLRWLELIFLVRGDDPLEVEKRLVHLRPQEQMEMPMFQAPAFGRESPLISGRKAYDIDLDRSVFDLIDADRTRVEAEAAEAMKSVVAKGLSIEAQMEEAVANWAAQSQADRAKYLRNEIGRFASDVRLFHSRFGDSLARNGGITSEALSNAVKTALASANAKVERFEIRTGGIRLAGVDDWTIEATVTISAPSAVKSLIARLASSGFPYDLRLESLNASEGRNEWRVYLKWTAYRLTGDWNRERVEEIASSAAKVSDSATQEDVEMLDLSLQSLRRVRDGAESLGRLMAKGDQSVALEFLSRMALDARAAGVRTFRVGNGEFSADGSAPTERSATDLRGRLATFAERNGLEEQFASQESTYGEKTQWQWNLHYRDR